MPPHDTPENDPLSALLLNFAPGDRQGGFKLGTSPLNLVRAV